MMNKITRLGLLLLPCMIAAYSQEQMEEMIEAGQEDLLYAYLNQQAVVIKPAPKKKKDNKTTSQPTTQQATTPPAQNPPAATTPPVEQASIIETFTASNPSVVVEFIETLTIINADGTEEEVIIIYVEDPADASEVEEIVIIDGSVDESILDELLTDSDVIDIILTSSSEFDEEGSSDLVIPSLSSQPYGMYQSTIEEYQAYIADGKLNSLKKALAILTQLKKTFAEDADFIDSDDELYSALVAENLYPVSQLTKTISQLKAQISSLEPSTGVLGWITSWFKNK